MSLRKFILEEGPHELIDTILKDSSKSSNVWFKVGKKRFVDPFIMGATRSVFFDLARRELNKQQRKRGYEVMNILELSDREELLFLMRVISYYDKIVRARTEGEKSKSHEVIFNLSETLTLTEEYFKAGWVELNPKQCFREILQSDNPDNNLIKDFDEELFPNEI